MRKLLQKLVEAWGPSGREEVVRAVVQAELTRTKLEVRTDTLGNLIATKPGQGGRMLIAAHMDEIGLMVTHVDDRGLLRFVPVGDLDPAQLLGARVIFTDGTLGTIGCEKIEELKELKLEKLFIDIGASTAQEAEATIQIGSMATFAPHLAFQGNRVLAKSLDNRAGCAILLALIRDLPAVEYQIDFVFTVQEEVGLRGARTAAYHLKPDLALAVDVTRTGDIPEAALMTVELGKGPAIKVKDTSIISHLQVRRLLEEAAKRADIPYQLEVLEKGGTDAGSIHLTREGVPTGVISIPARYLHSPVEVIDYRDLEHTYELLREFLQQKGLF